MLLYETNSSVEKSILKFILFTIFFIMKRGNTFYNEKMKNVVSRWAILNRLGYKSLGFSIN